MVLFALQITAELDSLTDLQPQGGCDDSEFTYLFKLKCQSCGELTQKETAVSLSEAIPLPVGKGTTNLLQKCKFCGREGSVTMIPGRGRPLTQMLSEAGKFAPLMVFECRGYEPVDYVFGGGWKVQSIHTMLIGPTKLPPNVIFTSLGGLSYTPPFVSPCSGSDTRTPPFLFQHKEIRILLAGTTFDNVDLSEEEFAEYDEKGECPVMISKPSSTFVVVK